MIQNKGERKRNSIINVTDQTSWSSSQMPGPVWGSAVNKTGGVLPPGKHVVGRRNGCRLSNEFHLAGPLFPQLENGKKCS